MRWLAALLLGFLVAPAAGAADRGFYIGAGAGEASIEDRGLQLDAKESSYRAFVGYRARTLPLLDLAGEATYIDYGSARQSTPGQTALVKIRGGELAGLAILPLGPLELYGRAGLVSWSSTRELNGASADRSGTNGVYGLGLGFRAGQLGVRAEYDYYDVSVVDRLKTYTLSFYFRFY